DRMGTAAFRELVASTPEAEDAETNAYVTCVADAITGALREQDRGDWEVRVFADDQVNAFALPGRKIGVYQGLLSVAENQHQLATVIGTRSRTCWHVTATSASRRASPPRRASTS